MTDQSGARRGRLRADALWRVRDGTVIPGHDAEEAEMLIVARRGGQQVEHSVARGAHDALLAELLAAGWSIEGVRAR